MTSPTQRTLAKLRAEGWTAEVTERWNPFAHIRQDLFGCIDVLAIRPGIILAVQCTSGSNVSSRLNKITALPKAYEWLRAGGRLEVWGWRKTGPRGERKVWQVRRVMLGIADGRIVEAEMATAVRA